MNKKDYINIFILSIMGLIIILITLGFGNMYGSETDWISQHWTFAEYFRTLFYETGNIFPNFAFNIGAGQNIYNFAYYGLLSPIILISYLLPFIKMVDYIMIVSVVSVFASVFLFYKWMRNNNFSSKSTMIAASLFLLASPLIFHSHRHIMFVNYIPFLILGLMGIDKYFNDNKRWLYSVSVFLMIMTSYYYSIGGLLAMVIYGVYQYLKRNKTITLKNILIDGLKFSFPIVIGIFLAGILLLPTIGVILNGRMGMDSSTSMWQMLVPDLNLGVLLYSSYSLGFTAIAVVALANSFLIKKKEIKFLAIVLSVLFLIPIFIYLLNGTLYIRAKVLIPFLPIIGLLIGQFFEELFKKNIKITQLIIILVVLSVIDYITGYRNINYYLDLLSIIFLLIVFKWKPKAYLLYVPVIITAFISCLVVNQDEKLVTKDLYNNQFDKTKENLIEKILAKDETFYRFNNFIEPLATVNKIYNPNYYQTSLYSSTYNIDYNHFFYNTYSNAVPYRNHIITAQTPNIMFQTLMGVKYVLANTATPVGYKLIEKNGDIGLYQNNDVLSLGYATSKMMNYSDFSKLDYPYNQEAILNNAIVERPIDNSFKSSIDKITLKYTKTVGSNLNINEENGKYTITAKEEDYIYLNLEEKIKNKILFIKFDVLESPSCKDGDIWININDIPNKLTCKSWMYHNQNYSFEYTISSPSDISQLAIKFSKGNFKIANIETYIMDYNLVKEAVNQVDKMVVDVNKTSADKISGKIYVKKDGYFVTTIPYDKGFTIKLNDKKVMYEKVNDSFIGLPIKAGNYDIKIQYISPLFNAGLVTSIIGLLSLIMVIILDKKNKRVKKEKTYEI